MALRVSGGHTSPGEEKLLRSGHVYPPIATAIALRERGHDAEGARGGRVRVRLEGTATRQPVVAQEGT